MSVIEKIKPAYRKSLFFLLLFVFSTIIFSRNVTNGKIFSELLCFLCAIAVLCLYDTFSSKIPHKFCICVCYIAIFISAIFMSFGANLLYCAANSAPSNGNDSWVRMALFLIPTLFIGFYVLFPTKSVFEFLHAKRWLIAACIFVFLVALKINLSNVPCFHYYIQPDSKTDFTLPILGTPRGIRSDEWLVDTPRRASAFFSHYGKINNIVRGTENFNISSSYLYLAYSALFNPFNFGYFLFGTEYGTSFYWCGIMIVSFMVSYEFCLILTKAKRILSLFGATVLGISSFSLWWSISAHLLGIQALIVCAYLFFRTQKRYAQILLAAGVALSGAYFICNLYPAWQVPGAYIILAMFLWVILVSFDRIKQMRWKEWIVIGGAFLFMCSIIIAYLHDTSAYREAVMQTIYPGQRFEAGGESFHKGSWYIQTILYPFRDTGNNSEAGTFFGLFPLPMLLALISVILQIIKRIKNKTGDPDYLAMFLLFPALLLTAYCTVGIPVWLAKLTLMSYSTADRAIDFLCLINAILLIRLLSYEITEKRPIPIGLGIAISTLLVLYNMDVTEKYFNGYMNASYISFITILIVALGTVLLCEVRKNVKSMILSLATVILLVSSLAVLPINRGMDSLYKKPASQMVQTIVNNDPNAKWIGYGSIVSSQFLIANGAPTVNSINYIPNMDLWNKIDSQQKYQEVYNRYCHVSMIFTEEETSFTLLQDDLITVNLCYSDIWKTDAKYVFANQELTEDSNALDLNLLYSEGNVFIYEILYL